jgi:hypothetical protein
VCKRQACHLRREKADLTARKRPGLLAGKAGPATANQSCKNT